jgi:hypothetical protein
VAWLAVLVGLVVVALVSVLVVHLHTRSRARAVEATRLAWEKEEARRHEAWQRYYESPDYQRAQRFELRRQQTQAMRTQVHQRILLDDFDQVNGLFGSSLTAAELAAYGAITVTTPARGWTTLTGRRFDDPG